MFSQVASAASAAADGFRLLSIARPMTDEQLDGSHALYPEVEAERRRIDADRRRSMEVLRRLIHTDLQVGGQAAVC